MLKSKLFKTASIALIALSLFIIKYNISSAATFNPNYIISDEEMLDKTAMSLEDIKSFLKGKGGFISTYSCMSAYSGLKTAAEIIYDAAANNYDCTGISLSANPTMEERKQKCAPISINPKFLIVLLQKEQSLIEDKEPRQSQLDWAMGYGCPDGQKCNDYWRGFGKQVNSAALQFYDYMMNPQRYTYRAGYNYTVTNTGRLPSSITPANRATAGLYNYTPHVYNGNYNFFNLWNKYFTRTYFDGTLMQVKGEAGVWLIQDGKRRAFLSRGALTTRYDINKIVTVNKADLESYPLGAPIKFPQYSLLRSPRGNLYLLIDDKRRGFADAEAFRMIGLNPEEIIEASWDDINIYTEIEPITATTSYPTGALIQNSKTGGVYWVADGQKHPIWDKVFLTTKFKFKPKHSMTPEKLDAYPTADPVKFDDGELLKSPASPAVFVTVNGLLRPFINGKSFEDLGYKWENVISVSQKILDLYTVSDPVYGPNEEPAGGSENGTASSTPEIALDNATGTPSVSSSTAQVSTSTASSSIVLNE